jgi:hypothetical protein
MRASTIFVALAGTTIAAPSPIALRFITDVDYNALFKNTGSQIKGISPWLSSDDQANKNGELSGLIARDNNNAGGSASNTHRLTPRACNLPMPYCSHEGTCCDETGRCRDDPAWCQYSQQWFDDAQAERERLEPEQRAWDERQREKLSDIERVREIQAFLSENRSVFTRLQDEVRALMWMQPGLPDKEYTDALEAIASKHKEMDERREKTDSLLEELAPLQEKIVAANPERFNRHTISWEDRKLIEPPLFF